MPPGPRRSLDDLLRGQDGVVARHQLVGEGYDDVATARLLRRRELHRVHPGVYVDHNGPLSDRQRAWAAVLAGWPAALTGASVLPGAPTHTVHVAISVRRTLQPLPGVRWHRVPNLEERVLWVRSPPRMRLEHAVIDAATGCTEHEQFQFFAEACGSRQTTPAALRHTLHGRTRVRGRRTMLALLDDLETGAASVLERLYLQLERDHGLPAAVRQMPLDLTRGRGYADAPYPAYGLVVELDGRVHHDRASDRERDADRDLDVSLQHRAHTLRLTWGQVALRGCATIAKVAALLERGGWPGRLVACPRCPDALRRSG